MEKFNYTTVDFSGETHEAIEYDGRNFIRPWFDGQAVGWVRERFEDWSKQIVDILLVTPEDWNLWYTLKFSESDRLDIGRPVIGDPLYFLTMQKRWHKPENLPYTITEGSHCDEYLAKYKLPYFMQK
jgi:hypothetical protein